MNKYIKTKDKIFRIHTNIYNQVFAVNGKGEWFEMRCVENDIIKQADTIEELCDYFYWDWEDRFSIHNFMNYSIAKDTWDEYVNDCLEDNEKPDRNMYGCIKTDKGIIYVAKMNEKGGIDLI